MIWYVLLGVALTHILWAAIFVGWWYFLIRDRSDTTSEQVTRDFQVIRNAVKRANARE